MRCQVVRGRGFLYFPVRRAASSAIQLALGRDFIDWRSALKQPSSFHRFTCYRNTFDRLASLYHNFVNPAPQGRVNFFDGDDFTDPPSFHDWITEVCQTSDIDCNEHLQSQDWHHLIDDITIYQFEDRGSIFKMLGASPEQLGKKSPDLSYLEYDDDMLRVMHKRYWDEIYEFRYEPS